LQHYQLFFIIHEQCMTLGSVTVHSLAQLKDLIMSELGGDLEGYSLLNVAQFKRPISERPQEPVLVLHLVPPEQQHDQPEEQVITCTNKLQELLLH
jgi:hypothetical protein